MEDKELVKVKTKSSEVEIMALEKDDDKGEQLSKKEKADCHFKYSWNFNYFSCWNRTTICKEIRNRNYIFTSCYFAFIYVFKRSKNIC